MRSQNWPCLSWSLHENHVFNLDHFHLALTNNRPLDSSFTFVLYFKELNVLQLAYVEDRTSKWCLNVTKQINFFMRNTFKNQNRCFLCIIKKISKSPNDQAVLKVNGRLNILKVLFSLAWRWRHSKTVVQWFSSLSMQFPQHYVSLYLTHPLQVLQQGCPNSVLEERCPAEFSSNLPQHTCMEASSILSKTLISCFRCV